MGAPTVWGVLIENGIWAGVAALGFAILFNVPKRALFACAACGTAGYLVRSTLIDFASASVEAATLLSAITIAFLGVWSGKRWRAPAPVFIIPGVIPLVPGALAFRTMIGVLTLVTSQSLPDQGLVAETALNLVKTVVIVGAIAGGIGVPRLLLRRHRPMT